MLIAICCIAGGLAWLFAVWIQKGHLFLCKEVPRCSRCAVPCDPPAADAELVRCSNCGGDLTRENGVETGIVRSTSRLVHSIVLALIGLLLVAPPLLRPDDVRRAESRLFPTTVLVDRYVARGYGGDELRHRLRTHDTPEIIEALVRRTVVAITNQDRTELEPLRALLEVVDAAKKIGPEQLHRIEAAQLEVTRPRGMLAPPPPPRGRRGMPARGHGVRDGFLRQIVAAPARIVAADGTETPIGDDHRLQIGPTDTVIVTVGIIPVGVGPMRLDYYSPEYWPPSVIRFEMRMSGADLWR